MGGGSAPEKNRDGCDPLETKADCPLHTLNPRLSILKAIKLLEGSAQPSFCSTLLAPVTHPSSCTLRDFTDRARVDPDRSVLPAAANFFSDVARDTVPWYDHH